MRTWGYLHCGFYFQRVFVIDDHGQLFRKGKHIPWNDIVAYKRFSRFLAWFLRWPDTTFFLSDGSHFTVHTGLEQEGYRPKPYFALHPGPTRAYGEFVTLLEGRSGATSIWHLRAGRMGLPGQRGPRGGLWQGHSEGNSALNLASCLR